MAREGCGEGGLRRGRAEAREGCGEGGLRRGRAVVGVGWAGEG